MNSHQVSSSFPRPEALETFAAQARSSLPANPKKAWDAALSANDMRFELMLRSRARLQPRAPERSGSGWNLNFHFFSLPRIKIAFAARTAVDQIVALQFLWEIGAGTVPRRSRSQRLKRRAVNFDAREKPRPLEK
jgi:hypothetical protein